MCVYAYVCVCINGFRAWRTAGLDYCIIVVVVVVVVTIISIIVIIIVIITYHESLHIQAVID